MSNIIEAASCTELISNACKIPDHSLLTVKMMNSYDLSSDEMTSQLDAESKGNSQNCSHRKMYYLDRNSHDFLSSPLWNDAVKSIIDKLTKNCNSYGRIWHLVKRYTKVELETQSRICWMNIEMHKISLISGYVQQNGRIIMKKLIK